MKLENSDYYICQLPPLAQGRWRSHLSQECTEPAPLASLKTTSPQSLFFLSEDKIITLIFLYEKTTRCKLTVAARVSLVCSFANEVLEDLGWNFVRKSNTPKSTGYLAFLTTLLLDSTILFSFLLWPYLCASSLWQIQEINPLEDNTSIFCGISLCVSAAMSCCISLNHLGYI